MRVLVVLFVAVTITAAYASSFLKNEEYTTVEGIVMLFCAYLYFYCIMHGVLGCHLREEAMYG